jgi:hypothetical protein
MKREPTLFLKGVVLLTGLAALAVCLIFVPEIVREDAVEHPETAWIGIPFMIGAYSLAVPFFIALHQVFKLVKLSETNRIFTAAAVKALHVIKVCAAIDAVLLVAGMAFGLVILRTIGEGEDAAGPAAIGIFLTFMTTVVATFVAVLQKLLQNAVDIKSENEGII